MIKSPLEKNQNNTLWAKKPGWMMERAREQQYVQVTGEVRGGAPPPLCKLSSLCTRTEQEHKLPLW